jgi:hypothetical protein
MRFRSAAISFAALCFSAWSVSASTAVDGATVHPTGMASLHGWIDRAALKGPLVYGAVTIGSTGSGAVNIYDAHLHMVGQLTGFGFPAGLAVDQQHNLYVADADTESVFEYPRGATTPSRVLNGARSAGDVTVAQDGTVYVSENDSSSGFGGDIAVYSPGSTKPDNSLVVQAGRDNIFFGVIANDSAGNVFAYVAPNNGSFNAEIVEFKAGQNPAHPLPAALQGNAVYGLATTPAGNLVVCLGGQIATFKAHGANPFRLPGVACEYTKLTPDGHRLLTPAIASLNRYLYPSGAPNGSVIAPAHEEFRAVAADGPASR